MRTERGENQRRRRSPAAAWAAFVGDEKDEQHGREGGLEDLFFLSSFFNSRLPLKKQTKNNPLLRHLVDRGLQLLMSYPNVLVTPHS